MTDMVRSDAKPAPYQEKITRTSQYIKEGLKKKMMMKRSVSIKLPNRSGTKSGLKQEKGKVSGTDEERRTKEKKTPNYMKPTSSSDARKETLQVNLHHSQSSSRDQDVKQLNTKNISYDANKSASNKMNKMKTLVRRSSLRPLRVSKISSNGSSSKIHDVAESKKMSTVQENKSGRKTWKTFTRKSSIRPIRISMKTSSVSTSSSKDVTRSTCSSTLKDTKFPNYLELCPGATEAQGTSVMKVCPYTYCSLNGHYHKDVPPLKQFIAEKRRSMKVQKSMKKNKDISSSKTKSRKSSPKDVDPDQRLKVQKIDILLEDDVSPYKPANSDGDDFFIEIYANSAPASDSEEDHNEVTRDTSSNGDTSKRLYTGQTLDEGETADLGMGENSSEAADNNGNEESTEFGFKDDNASDAEDIVVPCSENKEDTDPQHYVEQNDPVLVGDSDMQDCSHNMRDEEIVHEAYEVKSAGDSHNCLDEMLDSEFPNQDDDAVNGTETYLDEATTLTGEDSGSSPDCWVAETSRTETDEVVAIINVEQPCEIIINVEEEVPIVPLELSQIKHVEEGDAKDFVSSVDDLDEHNSSNVKLEEHSVSANPDEASLEGHSLQGDDDDSFMSKSDDDLIKEQQETYDDVSKGVDMVIDSEDSEGEIINTMEPDVEAVTENSVPEVHTDNDVEANNEDQVSTNETRRETEEQTSDIVPIVTVSDKETIVENSNLTMMHGHEDDDGQTILSEDSSRSSEELCGSNTVEIHIPEEQSINEQKGPQSSNANTEEQCENATAQELSPIDVKNATQGSTYMDATSCIDQCDTSTGPPHKNEGAMEVERKPRSYLRRSYSTPNEVSWGRKNWTEDMSKDESNRILRTYSCPPDRSCHPDMDHKEATKDFNNGRYVRMSRNNSFPSLNAFFWTINKRRDIVEDMDEVRKLSWRPGQRLPLEPNMFDWRRLNWRRGQILSVEPDPDAEKVDLRHQDTDERRSREEWMVDYALRQAVDKLAPVKKTKVAMLVEAFEAVVPEEKFKRRSQNFSMNDFPHAKPAQACS